MALAALVELVNMVASLKYSLVTILLLAEISFHTVLGIQCFRCTPKGTSPSSNVTERVEMCAKFDYSSKFLVDCPYSTFCMKRNFTLHFPDGSNAMVTERGCAHQVLSYKILVKGKWELVNDVNEDIYQEGCHVEATTHGNKPATLYCYCSGRLCNSSPKQNYNQWSLFVLVTSVLYLFHTH